MSRAEKFISDYTRNCSNEYLERCFTPWLTPDQARMAVEIAREEIYEWLQENAYKYSTVGIYTDAMITDLKKHLEGKK